MHNVSKRACAENMYPDPACFGRHLSMTHTTESSRFAALQAVCWPICEQEVTSLAVV